MPSLPEIFTNWFAARNWQLRAHQAEMLGAAEAGQDALLIAPTGAGKTLAGFLPSLIALAQQPAEGLHTLYVSPLKALGTDIARNLQIPVAEMGLNISIETRSGDTPANRRARQKEIPPNILLTTPESLLLLLSQENSAAYFATLTCVVVDEIHALAGTKRGDQFALCISRLRALSKTRVVGLSATVAHPEAMRRFVGRDARLVRAEDGAPPEVKMVLPETEIPWSGHMGLKAAEMVLAQVEKAGLSIVFVNTRAQAELIFAEIWKHNEKNLPIAIHHGSLDIAQRRKVETAMAEGRLRAVIATSSLDLGIDWGGVDQVLQIGAPKGVSRLLQRLGRANHRLDEPSRAVLVPANRFEVLECEAAMQGVREKALDGDPPRPGGLDVLAQHILGMACAGRFLPNELYREVISAAPYADLPRRDFDDVLRFVEDGGYALAAYERYRKLFRDSEGYVYPSNARVAQQFRMNIGTIVEAPMIKIRLLGRRGGFGTGLGEVEEYFVNQLVPGDSFIFAGRLLKFIKLRETFIEVVEAPGKEPKVPAYAGARMPLTTNLAFRVRAMLHDPSCWGAFPKDVREWLRLQKHRSRLPGPDGLLVETFPRQGRWFMVVYAFEGRNAHQTLGLLLTRRMERAGFAPIGFVATDYVLATWSAYRPEKIDQLFQEDMLGDDLEEWMETSSLLRRSFRQVAVIAGLIPRQLPGAEKNRRQITVNSDLIYDVLRKHQPDHVLLRATRADAAHGLIDLSRISALLARAKGRITHMVLSRVSPLAVPVLLEIGREHVAGVAEDVLLAEAEALIEEATAENEFRHNFSHGPKGQNMLFHRS
ncbi:MAG: ligase-associated DNA damage response DEXH box helicase [Rhodospirillales bacterium]|nr:ligase-associated DNA damage response DEXH box helicase [Rhodospirillales bacterium]